MGFLKLAENLFIGKEELDALQKFSNEDIYRILGLLTYSYGFVDFTDIVQNPHMDIANIPSFKVKSQSKMDIQIENPSYIFAYPNNLIVWNSSEHITIPEMYRDSVVWVKVSYYQHSVEEGSLQISEDGSVVGTGTKFTEKLRGEPNFPSKITLYAKNADGQLEKKMTYDVLSVNSDTSIQIDSYGGIDDTSITYYYAVAGTFEEGMLVSEEEQYPFKYDGCQLEFVQEYTEETAPDEIVMQTSNTEFYIARLVINSEGNVEVQDKRGMWNDLENDSYKIWTLKSTFTHKLLRDVRDNLQNQIDALRTSLEDAVTRIEALEKTVESLQQAQQSTTE